MPRKLIPKGVGKPDYTVDVGVSTLPVVRRWQTRVWSCSYLESPASIPSTDYALAITAPVLRKEDVETHWIFTNWEIEFDSNLGFEVVWGIADVEGLLEEWLSTGMIEDPFKHYEEVLVRRFVYHKCKVTFGQGYDYYVEEKRTAPLLSQLLGYPEDSLRVQGMLLLRTLEGVWDVTYRMLLYSIWIPK